MSKLKVKITAKQVIHYSQIVEMDLEDYKQIETLDSEDVENYKSEYEIIDDYINKQDVCFSDDEYLDVTVKKISG